MEWVYVYLTMIKDVPVLGVGKDNYKTQVECVDNNAGLTDSTFWCVPRNWLDDDQRHPVRAFVTD
jgi:hypothetical protein